MQELADGNFVFYGRETHYTSNTNSIFIVKLDRNGKFLSQNIVRSQLPGKLMIRDWKLLSDGSAIVVGILTNNFKDRGYIARISGVGVPAVSKPSVDPDSTNQNPVKNENIIFVNAFPNPAISTITFSYGLPENVFQAEIKLYELATGKYVKQIWLKNEEKQMQISVADLKPGMYAYSLLADDVPVSTKKLVIVK